MKFTELSTAQMSDFSLKIQQNDNNTLHNMLF